MQRARLIVAIFAVIAGVSAMRSSAWLELSLYEGGLKTAPGLGERSGGLTASATARVSREPNALLVKTIAGRRPGRALDLAVGDGRNAIMLAEHGWSVTGVDLSAAAVAQAKKNAAAHNVSLDAVVSDLEVYDFGKERWDLISSLYMHGWHDRSRTDVAARLYDALAPGGLLVLEGLAKPEVVYGFDAHAVRLMFGRFRIVRFEDVVDVSDWDDKRARHVVRLVAQKPLVTPVVGSRVQRFKGSKVH